MAVCGIYGIHNDLDGKWYVGQSVDLLRRLSVHMSRLKAGTHYSPHLQRAFKKYGLQSFSEHVLEICNQDMLDVREQAWIEYYQCTDKTRGYNSETGGTSGYRHSEEQKKKIIAKLTGRICSEETKRKISEAHKGMRGPKMPEHVRLKIRQANLGRKHTAEARMKMSIQRTAAELKKKELSNGL